MTNLAPVAVREGPAGLKSHPHWRQQRIQRAGQDVVSHPTR